MRRAGLLRRSGLAIVAFLAWGCGDPFAPPPVENAPPTSASDLTGARTIYMIFPEPPKGEHEVWGLMAHREANNHQLVFRLMGPPPDRPEMSQAEVIPRAVADGASALVVVPGDSPGLGRALADAEAKGIPVVLVGRTIPSPAGAKPFSYVDLEPFELSADKIVASALEDAKKAGRPAKGTVLLLADKTTDATSARRMAALKAAVEASGIGPTVDVIYDGARAASSKDATLEAIKAHPDTLIVLADEGEGMSGAMGARIALAGNPAVFVGGYVGYRSALSTTVFARESCFVEGRSDELSRLAVQVALKRLDGVPTKEKEVLPSEFHRGSGEVASAGQEAGPTRRIDSAGKPGPRRPGDGAAPTSP